MFKVEIATKEKVKLMIGLTGPSGAGKTLSALKLAYGITGDWSKITVADTENRSSLYYAGDKTGPWNHVDFPPTLKGAYHPRNWSDLIQFVESDSEAQVLILDSISHEWQGVGGCLELLDSFGKGASGWKSVTPLHNRFVDRMRTSRLHIIATMRSIQEYAFEQNEKGKTAPQKLGMKSIQREGMDYEFGIVFDLNMKHFAVTSKDRTGLFAPRGHFQIDETIGQELFKWSRESDTKRKPIFNKDNKMFMDGLERTLKEKGQELHIHWLSEALHGQEMQPGIVDRLIEEKIRLTESTIGQMD